MEDILLVHRKSNSKSFAETAASSSIRLPLPGPVWKTCLRQILFLESSNFSFEATQDDHILRGQDALAFLLEVLCGLHSPVIGETEVLGQFKNFVQEQRDLGNFHFSDNRKWLQFVMAEVKRLRTVHVSGLGSNSYGSLIRRHTRENDHLSLLGAGQLVSEILPWVALKKELQVVSRHPEKLQAFADKWTHLNLETYASLTELNEVLVIAAPIEDLRILNLLQSHGSKVRRIFDLRGETNQLPEMLANTTWKVVSLADLFAELEDSRKENVEKIKSLKNLIAERVVQFTERSELRPLGWDDLCA